MAAKPENNSIPNPTASSQSNNKVHSSDDSEADPNSYLLEKFKLYETRARFYLMGSDRNKRFFRVLKIDRCEPSELNISEDPVVYSPQEVKSLLQRIAEGNRATGGLNFVAKVYGIAGCIKFLESYYLILVTKRRQIGSICGHAIYAIDESQMITIPHASVQSDVAYFKTELRYKKLLSSVDLTKDFFYSYTYPIMQSLQKNVQSRDPVGIHYDSRFVWNSYLTEAVRTRCKNNIWTVALVHGHFKQTRMSIFGRDFSVALVARRSRHFAGTRYLKRGVNDRGRVANDVETEQLVLDEDAGSCKGKMSSVVQMRGSIPLFWSQEASRFSPKPDIILQRYDPTYEATRLHFEDLVERYGNPIIVLNLIKTVEKRPREMMLRREFANAVTYLNEIFSEEKHLTFIHWDFHKFAKTKTANVLGVLAGVASQALNRTGFYYSGKQPVVKKRAMQLSRTNTVSSRDASLIDLRANSGTLARSASNNELLKLSSSLNRERDSDAGKHIRKYFHNGDEPRFQNGALRTNCIDCLDRTNVAQYAYGLEALGRQLQAMRMSFEPKVDPDSSIATALMDMYWSMGDALAQQYGGSAAHNTVFPDKQGKWKATTQSREFLKSIKRYYSNAYTDGEKQDAINLFLGYFRPKEGKPALWELDSDYYLHVVGVGDDASSLSTDAMSFGVKASLEPVPACREDFSRIKLTSFDKLIERTCSMIKDVRLCCEPGQRIAGIAGTSGVAPDAIEIQLKSPNWLFGLRKDEQIGSSPKVVPGTDTNDASQDASLSNGFSDLNWLSEVDDCNDEDIFKRYLAMSSVDEANGWCGGTLLGDLDENSEIYKHYAQLCEGPAMEPFENDLEREQHYADVMHGTKIENVDDAAIEAEMEAALREYDQVAADLGISAMCRSLAGDPSQLTRWIIGEEKLYRI
ncbi:phosphatidylinositol-3-phosphatase SAC1 isoform X1 [Beta vulgaris subsp. vulgaris]|uniref:phosphatidylinositol-3-phosphatase SAC1 isoform X1 n=1 Tax=Beta vulgaris subsp. vulgaris TaxID=3555 RepID=UPI0020366709|nr:phosphatidylinositol-3-phosphatase SAC1 isoform X1 [Beta vulgaris subsp. vulgaris]XP_048498962.1 phosphatidylinositol-3-phosphatase SAC1 isoform X1 [Beta vulgaris subsp. vulgaris]